MRTRATTPYVSHSGAMPESTVTTDADDPDYARDIHELYGAHIVEIPHIPADHRSRAIAFLIDVVVYGAVLGGIYFVVLGALLSGVVDGTATADEAAAAVDRVTLLALYGWAVNAIVVIAADAALVRWATTPGRALARVRVVDELMGTRVTFKQSLMRSVPKWLLLFAPNFVAAFVPAAVYVAPLASLALPLLLMLPYPSGASPWDRIADTKAVRAG